MALLRHTPTGDLYPYNPDLARRDDMVAYTPPPDGSVEVTAAVVEDELVIQPNKATKRVTSAIKNELPNLDDL